MTYFCSSAATAPVIWFLCNRNLPHPGACEPSLLLTQRVDYMDLLLCVVVDGVGVVEPAVVGVPLLAVHQRVGGVIGLGQLVPVLHFDQVKVAAVFLAFVLLLTSAKRPALDTLSGGNRVLALVMGSWICFIIKGLHKSQKHILCFFNSCVRISICNNLIKNHFR